MLKTTMRRSTCLVLLAATLSVSATADDEVRIGRYATVVLDLPLTEIETTPRLNPMVLPDDVSSRADAVQRILEQHDYQLHEDTSEAFDLASMLAAPLSIRPQEHLPRSLRLALHAVLGPAIAVLIDPSKREVVLSILDTHADSKDEAGSDQ